MLLGVRYPLVGLALSLVVIGGTATAQGRIFLLTPDEAAQLRLGPEDRATGPLLRGLPAGPRIVVREPAVKSSPDGSVIETTPLTREQAMAMAVDLSRRSAPAEAGSAPSNRWSTAPPVPGT